MTKFQVQYFAFGGWWTLAVFDDSVEAFAAAETAKKRCRIREIIAA